MKIAEYNCYLSLGANLGDRQASLRAALQRLDCLPGSSLSAVSSFYETAPWGRTEQPPFLNLAACLRTQLTPERLLDCCQKIEADLGRERKEKWGPRVMDIDLLRAPGKSIDQPRLQLPHPYLLERAFVLVPLAEIAGDVEFQGKPFGEWLALCPDTGSVRRLNLC